jgi:FixJ family two-component response regulator
MVARPEGAEYQSVSEVPVSFVRNLTDTTHELAEAIQRILEKLDGRRRKLWDLMATGMRLREVANELAISYETAKRERRKLLHWFRIHLRGFKS